MQQAVHYDPGSWETYYALALAQGASGIDPRPAAARALRMDPLEPLTGQEVSEFRTSSPTRMGQPRGQRARRRIGQRRSVDRPVMSASSVHRLAQLAQGPVYAALHRCERLSGQLGDLRDGQVGAEAQRDRLALLCRSATARLRLIEVAV